MKPEFWTCPRCGVMFANEDAARQHQRWWVHVADWKKLWAFVLAVLIILGVLALFGTFQPSSCADFDVYEGEWVERDCTWRDSFWGRTLP